MNAVAQIYQGKLDAVSSKLDGIKASIISPTDAFRAIYAERLGAPAFRQAYTDSSNGQASGLDTDKLISSLSASGATGADMLNALGMLAMGRLSDVLAGRAAEPDTGTTQGEDGADGEIVDAVSSALPQLQLKTTEYEELIQKASGDYSLPAYLIKGVIATESSFRQSAVSSCGAEGLMQLMPGTARMLGVTDSFDPAQNIDGGTRYLRQLIDRYDGDVRLALAAYNCGPGRVAQMIEGADGDVYESVASSVRGYVDNVISNARKYAI